MPIWLMFASQAAQVDPAFRVFDLADMRSSGTPTVASRCGANEVPGEIVVCGQGRDRYRLPLPRERGLVDRATGEASTGLAALTPPGACGIFAGERRCSKKEAAEYGYGDGRDPITVVARLARKAIDPDAD